MNDDPLERLLAGYRPPDVPAHLDHRVLEDGVAALEKARARATLGDAARALLQHLGFGYFTWLIDLVTSADAEYRVELI